ncbi:MAG: hypothetical protein JF588_16240 [Caulobacterales bacterium]|nr:hypothetical protein [Caulobacterales bacterium]
MTPDSARDDLAFLRALVDPPGTGFQRRFGETYAWCGACYGTQMVLHGLQYLGLVDGALAGLLIGLGPTVVFVSALPFILRRHRASPGASAISRAVGAVFSAVGVANLVLVVAIGSLAWRERSLTIWLLYPTTVVILQGAAWMVVYALRRRLWLAAVAIGWFATGIGMALAIKSFGALIPIAGFGFFAFMCAPGLFLMRQNRGA